MNVLFCGLRTMSEPRRVASIPASGADTASPSLEPIGIGNLKINVKCRRR